MRFRDIVEIYNVPKPKQNQTPRAAQNINSFIWFYNHVVYNLNADITKKLFLPLIMSKTKPKHKEKCTPSQGQKASQSILCSVELVLFRWLSSLGP